MGGREQYTNIVNNLKMVAISKMQNNLESYEMNQYIRPVVMDQLPGAVYMKSLPGAKVRTLFIYFVSVATTRCSDFQGNCFFFFFNYSRESLPLLCNYGHKGKETSVESGKCVVTMETRYLPLIYQGQRFILAS